MTRTGTRTRTGTWTTGETAIALCSSCSRANKNPKGVSVVADDADVRFCDFKSKHLTIPGIV